MVGVATTIYEYVFSLLGAYTPVVIDGEAYTNWTYITACACLLIALWFSFRGLLMLLKGVLGRYA